MKRFISILILTTVLVACQKSDDSSIDAAVATDRFLNEFVGQGGDPDALDSIFTDDYRLHTAGQTLTKDQFKEFAAGLRAAAPDVSAKFRVLEITGDQSILFETVTGTHTGDAPLFGVPTTGRAFSFTNLHIFTTRGNRIAEHWAQPDLGPTFAQLQGQIPASSHEDLWSALDAAQTANGEDCRSDAPQTDSAWIKWRAVMKSLDSSDATLDSILTENFRLSAGGNLNQNKEGVKSTFAMAGAIGREHDNSGMEAKYIGKRYVAAYGPVAFTYDNSDGKFNFPKSKAPVAVKMNELQIIGRCDDRVFHQFSHADVGGLLQQIAPAKSDEDIAIAFLRLPPEEVGTILAPDFHHESPFGKFVTADAFVAHFAANEPPEWSIEINTILKEGSVFYLDYNLVVPGMKFRIIDRLVIAGGLVKEGRAYFLDLPPVNP